VSAHTREDLVRGLEALGLVRGDVVLVRAALRKIGPVQGRVADLFLRALFDVVGEEGTILGLSFTKTFLFPARHTEYVFDGTQPPVTGGLAAALLGWPGAVRSRHPTNSFAAVGRRAAEILSGHDAGAPCFRPMEEIVRSGGKMILVGCLDESPGFSTVHLVQDHLGLSRRSLLGRVSGVLYRDGDEVRVYRKRDVPGCSMGFGTFYEHYERAGKLRRANVGDADSMGIVARDAYEIEYPLVRDDPRFPLCRNPGCESCRGTLLYNLREAPFFWARHGWRVLRGVLESR
jgi:aminoglycoside N3'-acetyltransferase